MTVAIRKPVKLQSSPTQAVEGGALSVTSLILSGVAAKQVSGGPEKISFQDDNQDRVCIAVFKGQDANARFLLDMKGNMEWSHDGGDQTVLFNINAAGRMVLSGQSGGGLNIVRWTSPGVLESQPRIALDNDGSGIKLGSGSAATDVRIYRPTADQLNFVGHTIGFVDEGASFPAITFESLNSSTPEIKFGSGSAAPDVVLRRSQADRLFLDGDEFFIKRANTQLIFNSSGNFEGGFLISVSADQAIMAGGAHYNGTNWVARATSAGILATGGGGLGNVDFLGDTGLTVGNTFSPTTLGAFRPNIADTETALLVRRNVGGTFSLVRVSMGATDSGGSGFKVLRVPN